MAMKQIHDSDQRKHSLFFKRILNNRTVTTLLILFLIMLVIFMFTKIAYLFEPVAVFINLVAFPIISAGILYYLFYPLVDKMAQFRIDKRVAIWGIFAIIIALIVWGVYALAPVLRSQVQSFINNLPMYTEQVSQFINNLGIEIGNDQFLSDITALFGTTDFNSITDQLQSILTSTFGGLGSVIGSITQFVTGLLIIPIILYYLLLEGHSIPKNILYYVPTKYREPVKRMLFRSNFQISQYIRGQIIVALIVGVMFAIGYSIIGLDYAILLAVIAALCNIIPYLGSFIAVVPALIIGALTSPIMFIKVAIVLGIEQFIEGRFVSPQVLGNNLKIHPITILFVLLGSGRLFGVTGVILGVPAYAVIKVIVGELYNYYRQNSSMYEDDQNNSSDTYDEFIEQESKESKETEEISG